MFLFSNQNFKNSACALLSSPSYSLPRAKKFF
nr:MAG TPA: hypothetical protein [Caudoviricetes sp.]